MFTDYNTYCGNCDWPKFLHPEELPVNETSFVIMYGPDGFNETCFRVYANVGTWEGDYAVVDGETIPISDYSGPESLIIPLLTRSEDEYDPEVIRDLSNYTDRFPLERTVSLQEYRLGKRPLLPTEIGEDLNVKVEGFDGFTSTVLLDLIQTRRHHARLLNVFKDKDGYLRCGSVRIVLTDEGVHAQCVKCKGTQFSNFDVTEDQMETFVYGLICHGNNHAAKFITERSDYYQLSPVLAPAPADEKDETRMLVEHHKVCKTVGCQCTELLMLA